jgi:hypothetical protein
VVDKLVDYLGELAEQIPSEDLDDLMKDFEAIEKYTPKKYIDDLANKVEKLDKRFMHGG